ncbi:MAG: MlaD family protein [Acidimicrobiales bacterium]
MRALLRKACKICKACRCKALPAVGLEAQRIGALDQGAVHSGKQGKTAAEGHARMHGQRRQRSDVTAGGRRARMPYPLSLSAAALVLMGSVLSACGGDPAGAISTSALFSNTSDLVSGAPVQFADITVGRVTSITLHDSEARVSMSVNRSARVPADVTAELRRTTLLGQRIVELVQPEARSAVPLLANGAVISQARVVPGIQQLLESGAQVFGAINTQELSQLVATGAQGLGGQGATLHRLLSNFADVAHGYATQTGTISSLVGNMDRLSSALAPSAQGNAQAISNLAATTGILAREANQFNGLLQSLQDLAVQGRGILQSYTPQIDTQIKALYALSQTLSANQRQIAGIISYLPTYEKALSSVVRNRYLQIIDAIIICGVPGGGASSTSSVSSCSAGGGG